MLKRFVWKENVVYSIQLTSELYILAQLLTKPYTAFFNIHSRSADFENVTIDLRTSEPLGVCVVLKEFFKKCAVQKMPLQLGYRSDIPLPHLFISPDKEQWGNRSNKVDKELIYNLVRIDPSVGDQGILGNEIAAYDILKNDPHLLLVHEMVGYNTGYEFIRRLLLSVEHHRWIDPVKEKLLLGNDPYPYQTLEELWAAGVPKYE